MSDTVAKKSENRSVELEAPVETVQLAVTKPTASTQKPLQQLPPQPAPRSMIEQPLSQIANDRLLPEDDLHSFFKNRAMASRSDFGISTGITIFAAVVVAAVFFIIAYNQKPRFAIATDRATEKWLGIKLDSYIPALGNRAKTKKTTQIALQKLATSPALTLDPSVYTIRSGQWSKTEQKLDGKCQTWEASADCAIKGLYYVHRGMPLMAKPMLAVSEKNLASLPYEYKSYWFITTALISSDPASRQRRFQSALTAIPPKNIELKRIIYDEMLTGLTKVKAQNDLPRFLRSADTEPRNVLSKADLAKWHALAAINFTSTARQTFFMGLLKEDLQPLKADLQTLILLTPEMIRSGLAAQYSPIVADTNTSLATTAIDKELRKNLYQSSIRLKYALGQKAEYAALLVKYGDLFGHDPFFRQFNSAMQLHSGGVQGLKIVLQELKGLKPAAPWETWVVYGFALVKTGQAAKIDSTILALSARSQPPTIQMWGTILKGEKLLAMGKADEAEKALQAAYAANPNHSAIIDLMLRISQAKGDIQQVGVFRSKLDDLKEKTSYWSSPEMLRSPFGPLALIK